MACTLPNLESINSKISTEDKAHAKQMTMELSEQITKKMAQMLPPEELEKLEHLPEALFLTGKIMSMQHRWSDAIACFSQVLMLKSDYVEAMLELGIPVRILSS